MIMNKGVRAVLMSAAVAIAVASVPAAGGAADARPGQHKGAILRAIL